MYHITDKTIREKVYAALSGQDREFRQRISFGFWSVSNGVRSFSVSRDSSGKEMIQTEGIRNLNISQQGNGNGSGLVMGCCCSSSCSTDIYNIDSTFNYSGKIIFVESGIKLDDESFYFIPMGYFIIDNPETDDNGKTISFTAYDDVAKMTGKWSSSLNFPNTAKAVFEEIAGKYHISIAYGSGIESTLAARTVTEVEASLLNVYTEREVLGFIAGLVGANARINTEGKLKVDWYTTPSSSYAVDIPANLQWQNGFKKISESPFVINSITSGIDDAVFTAGTGKGISFANPIITEAEIMTAYILCNQKSFQPCTCEWRGNPCVECGDIISATDRNGTKYTIYVANQEIDLTGGLSMVISCPSGDAEISFDTVNERTRIALNKQKTELQTAIESATNAINGAKGGYYEVNDIDNDGNPDEWIIKQDESGTTGIIRANSAGIGLSTDGGKTYRTAITYNGINADEINTGVLKAERIPTINSDKIAAGAVTTDKLNVGDMSNFCTLNPVTMENDKGEKYRYLTSDEVSDADNSNIDETWIRPENVYLSSEPFYVSMGKWIQLDSLTNFNFRFSGEFYIHSASSTTAKTFACVLFKYPDGGTVVLAETVSAGNITGAGYLRFDKTLSLPTTYSGKRIVAFKPVAYFRNGVGDWFAFRNLSFRRSSAGDITAGKLQSIDGETYFDLDNNIIKTNNAHITGGNIKIGADDYYTKIERGKITQHLESDESEVGGLVPTGANDTIYQTLYYENADGICIAKNEDSVYKPILEIKENQIVANTKEIKNNCPTVSTSECFSGFCHKRWDNTNRVYGTIKAGVGVFETITTEIDFFEYSALSSTNKTSGSNSYYAATSLTSASTLYRLTKWMTFPAAVKSLKISFNCSSYGHAYFYLAYKTQAQIDAGSGFSYVDDTYFVKVTNSDIAYSGTIDIPIDAVQWAIGVKPDTGYSGYWAGWRNVSISTNTNKTSAALELLTDDEVTARIDIADSWGEAVGIIKLTTASGTSSWLELGNDSRIWFNGNLIHDTSSEKYKTEISRYTADALDIVNQAVIYSYKYIHDGDNAPTKYGVIIERECPTEVIDNSGDAISLYSMCSILWKSVQELSKKIKLLEVTQNA